MELAPTSLLGVVLAIGAAASFAIQYLFVRIGTTEGSVSDIMLVSLCCNVILVVPVAAILSYPAYAITGRSLLAFVIAGVVGSLLARVLEYTSVERISILCARGRRSRRRVTAPCNLCIWKIHLYPGYK